MPGNKNNEHTSKLPLIVKAVIFWVVMIGLWIWLYFRLAAGNSDMPTVILSTLIFAGDDRHKEICEIIGEIVGKLITGTGLCSLLYGGAVKAARGVKSIFTVKGFSIGSFLMGTGAASAAYIFCAGFVGIKGVMVAVCGALTALEMLSAERGIVYSCLSRISYKRTPDGKRSFSPGRYKGLLCGAVTGNAAAFILCVTTYNEKLALWLTMHIIQYLGIVIPVTVTVYLAPAAVLAAGIVINVIADIIQRPKKTA